jgi:hypothetical protein
MNAITINTVTLANAAASVVDKLGPNSFYKATVYDLTDYREIDSAKRSILFELKKLHPEHNSTK